MSGASKVRSRKVLLVDSDQRTSHRLADLLNEDGFEVDVVSDGASAIARLSHEPVPGTLITELAVPLADGETVARHARALDPCLQVIVLTRYPHLLAPARLAGPAPVVLTKPLEYSRLIELLEGEQEADPSDAQAASPRN